MRDRPDLSSLTLHKFLRDEQQVILDEWRHLGKEKIAASRELSDSEQRNNVPDLIESIAASAEDVSRSHDVTELPRKWPRLHAEHRWNLGFSLEEMTREYSLLRDAIFRQLLPRMNDLTIDEAMFIHLALDNAIIEGVIHLSVKQRTIWKSSRSG